MTTHGTDSRQLIASVTSGLCNRLWVLAGALRLADQCDRQVVLMWMQRTGRVGLPYEGDESSSLEDFFRPNVEGLTQIIPVTSPPVLPEGAAGLDYGDVHELTLALQAGKPLDISPELAAKAAAPRILDIRHPDIVAEKDIWINLSTMPVGGPDDRMEELAVYPSRLGINHKNAYLKSLSTYARRLQLRPDERKIVDQLVSSMRGAPGGAKLVGIHVRTTDLRQRSTIDRNRQIANIIYNLTCVPGQGARIYLACDSESWLTDFMQTSLQPQTRAAITTYNNPVKYENSVAGSRAAVIDLYTLAACDTIYGTAGSSFSSYAWLLSDAVFSIHS